MNEAPFAMSPLPTPATRPHESDDDDDARYYLAYGAHLHRAF